MASKKNVPNSGIDYDIADPFMADIADPFMAKIPVNYCDQLPSNYNYYHHGNSPNYHGFDCHWCQKIDQNMEKMQSMINSLFVILSKINGNKCQESI
uniref:Uncharacterized protein n=1 Tax=Romanomermis culicivorax TaxID=13658 RepID=A0A915JAS0_ROMCU